MSVEAKAQDPVCGMEVDERSASRQTSYNGQEYYFCCPRCEVLCEHDPEQYSQKPGTPPGSRGGELRCGCAESTFSKQQTVHLGATLPVTKSESTPALHHDVVCGMDIEEQDTVGSVEYQGSRYLFCSQSCVGKFRADAARYLHPDQTPSTPANVHDVEYTCPMDPEIALC